MDDNYKDRVQKLQQIHRLSAIIGFKVPVDGLLTWILGMPIIDIIALDRKLQAVFYYEGSMTDFILQQFGNEAFEIIENNLN